MRAVNANWRFQGLRRARAAVAVISHGDRWLREDWKKAGIAGHGKMRRPLWQIPDLVSFGEWFGESIGEGYLLSYNLHKR